MTAKEYMDQVQKAGQELEILAAKKRHYIDLMQSIGAKMDKVAVVGNTFGSSKTETAAVGLAELAEQIDKKIGEYTKTIKEAEALIDKLPQEKFRAILTYKYLCNLSWRTIRDKMDYKDEKSVFACHRYALKALQGLM